MPTAKKIEWNSDELYSIFFETFLNRYMLVLRNFVKQCVLKQANKLKQDEFTIQ